MCSFSYLRFVLSLGVVSFVSSRRGRFHEPEDELHEPEEERPDLRRVWGVATVPVTIRRRGRRGHARAKIINLSLYCSSSC